MYKVILLLLYRDQLWWQIFNIYLGVVKHMLILKNQSNRSIQFKNCGGGPAPLIHPRKYANAFLVTIKHILVDKNVFFMSFFTLKYKIQLLSLK